MLTCRILSEEKMKEIYIDERFRNAVAWAGECNNQYGEFKRFKALSYPLEYIVTEEQKKEAQNEYERAKAAKIKSIKRGTIVFTGMGMIYKKRFDGDICNHRIRSYFKNSKGHRFFLEFCAKSNDEGFYCTGSEDMEREENEKKGIRANEPYHHSKQLERKNFTQRFSEKNLLCIINRSFDCKYERLEVDNYTLRGDDFISEC